MTAVLNNNNNNNVIVCTSGCNVAVLLNGKSNLPSAAGKEAACVVECKDSGTLTSSCVSGLVNAENGFVEDAGQNVMQGRPFVVGPKNFAACGGAYGPGAVLNAKGFEAQVNGTASTATNCSGVFNSCVVVSGKPIAPGVENHICNEPQQQQHCAVSESVLLSSPLNESVPGQYSGFRSVAPRTSVSSSPRCADSAADTVDCGVPDRGTVRCDSARSDSSCSSLSADSSQLEQADAVSLPMTTQQYNWSRPAVTAALPPNCLSKGQLVQKPSQGFSSADGDTGLLASVSCPTYTSSCNPTVSSKDQLVALQCPPQHNNNWPCSRPSVRFVQSSAVSLAQAQSHIPTATAASPIFPGAVRAPAPPAPNQQATVIVVPFGWQRHVNGESVVYVSPSNKGLGSLEEVQEYLQTPGTCKCGLQCPLQVDKVFSFDPKVVYRAWTLADMSPSDPHLSKLCNHKRKLFAMATLHNSTGPHPATHPGGGGGLATDEKKKDGRKRRKKASPYDGLLVSQLLAQRERLKGGQDNSVQVGVNCCPNNISQAPPEMVIPNPAFRPALKLPGPVLPVSIASQPQIQPCYANPPVYAGQGSPSWEDPKRRKVYSTPKSKKHKYSLLDRGSPCPNVDVRQIPPEHNPPPYKGFTANNTNNNSPQNVFSVPTSVPSFMEDPNGYLAQQTAMLNQTISQQKSIPITQFPSQLNGQQQQPPPQQVVSTQTGQTANNSSEPPTVIPLPSNVPLPCKSVSRRLSASSSSSSNVCSTTNTVINQPLIMSTAAEADVEGSGQKVTDTRTTIPNVEVKSEEMCPDPGTATPNKPKLIPLSSSSAPTVVLRPAVPSSSSTPVYSSIAIKAAPPSPHTTMAYSQPPLQCKTILPNTSGVPLSLQQVVVSSVGGHGAPIQQGHFNNAQYNKVPVVGMSPTATPIQLQKCPEMFGSSMSPNNGIINYPAAKPVVMKGSEPVWMMPPGPSSNTSSMAQVLPTAVGVQPQILGQPVVQLVNALTTMQSPVIIQNPPTCPTFTIDCSGNVSAIPQLTTLLPSPLTPLTISDSAESDALSSNSSGSSPTDSPNNKKRSRKRKNNTPAPLTPPVLGTPPILVGSQMMGMQSPLVQTVTILPGNQPQQILPNSIKSIQPAPVSSGQINVLQPLNVLGGGSPATVIPVQQVIHNGTFLLPAAGPTNLPLQMMDSTSFGSDPNQQFTVQLQMSGQNLLSPSQPVLPLGVGGIQFSPTKPEPSQVSAVAPVVLSPSNSASTQTCEDEMK